MVGLAAALESTGDLGGDVGAAVVARNVGIIFAENIGYFQFCSGETDPQGFERIEGCFPGFDGFVADAFAVFQKDNPASIGKSWQTFISENPDRVQ